VIPLVPLVEMLDKPVVIVGAKTADAILFKERLNGNSKLYVATDDGSLGIKGFSTDIARELLKRKKFDVVYTCGPEMMMKAVFNLTEQ